MKYKILNIQYIVFSFLFLNSCNINSSELTTDERKIADSLYRIESRKNVQYLDSICDSVYHDEYPKMVDSMKEIRMSEIKDLIDQ